MKTPPLALTAVIALAAPAYAQDATEKFAASETAFSKCLAKQAETRADYFVPGIGFLPGKLIANCYGDWWQFHNACLRTGAALSECAGLTNALAMNAAVSGGQQNRSARVGNVQSANPSFDCGKARTQDEHIICSDSRLSELDQAIILHTGRLKRNPRTRLDQRQAIASHRGIHAVMTDSAYRISKSMQ